jgi:hypothetical protein
VQHIANRRMCYPRVKFYGQFFSVMCRFSRVKSYRTCVYGAY